MLKIKIRRIGILALRAQRNEMCLGMKHVGKKERSSRAICLIQQASATDHGE